VRIAILVEGKTEKAFKRHLLGFLKTRLAGKMPRLDFDVRDGSLPTGEKLQRVVQRLLDAKRYPANAVIALTDVYPEYENAADAKAKMKAWVPGEDRFHVHVALHDFEAWLLPYWDKIQKLTGSNRKSPGGDPEKVNHNNPPAYRLAEVYRIGTKTQSYIKTRDGGRILQGENLMVAIEACSELKSFVNRILTLYGVKKGDLV